MSSGPQPRRVALALACVLLASCTDGTAPTDLGSVAPSFVVFNPVFGSAQSGEQVEVERIRVTARDSRDGTILGTSTEDVDPNQSQWTLVLELDLKGAAAIQVVVDVELIHLINNVEQAVWSGRVGPFEVTAGQNVEAGEVLLYQGGLANLSVTSVEIGSAALTVEEGGDLTLFATVQGAAGEPTVFWSSLDAGIAAVSERGLVSGLLPGEARIVAQAGPRADTATVSVLPRVAAIEVTPAEQRIESLGESVTYRARVLDPRGGEISGQTITWSSRRDGVGRSVGGGVFESVGNGSTWVIAESTSGLLTVRDSARLVVEQRAVILVLEPTEIAFSSLGESRQLRADFRDAGGSPAEGVSTIWTSENERVVTVDARGIVTSVGDGTASVTVEGQGLRATAAATVQQVVASVMVTPTRAKLGVVGESVQFTADILDARGHAVAGASVAWSSSNEGVATVDQRGLATAVGGGRTTIDATAGRIVGGADLSVDLPVSTHLVYVSNTYSHDMTFIDLRGGTSAEFDCGALGECNNPRNLAVNHSGTLAAVPFRHSDEVGIFDPSVPGFVAVITDASLDEPYAVAFTEDDRELWIANKKGGDSSVGSVTIVDMATKMVVAVLEYTEFESPEGLAIGGGRAFVVNRQGGTATVVSVASRMVLDDVSVGGDPRDAVVTPDGQWAYVTSDSGYITKIRLSDGTTTVIPMASGWSRNISMSPDGKRVYVATQNGSISVVDVGTDAVREITFAGAGETYGVTILQDGSRGFVSDVWRDKVFQFDPATEMEIVDSTFPLGVGYEPRGITGH